MREIVTSLGPAYIKLGQALSIRPDILSPAAMTELQKLCDKVSLLLLYPFIACFLVYMASFPF
jgi:predicted unusual protein kinase regulating ubiquinone biosynthesis (AarF/ABC1/UbiB family)